jgi:hypothetical protein
MSAPRPTAVWLVGTLALTAGALAGFLADTGATVTADVCLAVLTALFTTRVVGQLVVVGLGPSWLPPMGEWNFMPYRFLLPAQLVLLALMTTVVVDAPAPGPVLAWVLVAFAFLYWAAMAVRYALRMARRPEARWLGGTIPIVFHGVLAAFIFVLGASHTA